MRRTSLALLSFALVCVSLASYSVSAEPEVGKNNPVVEGNNRFAFDLYKQLGSDPQENLFFSPSSISIALSMTMAGARGETATEMAQVLQVDRAGDSVHDEYAQLLESWSKPTQKDAYELRLANRLWGQKGFNFQQPFLELTREQYGAELAQVDFARAEAARKEINTWIEEQTAEKIKDLIPEGALDDRTRLVLTNAIYFKGDWQQPFDEKATREQEFHVTADKKVKAPLMFRKAPFLYGETEDVQLLSMPYAGEDLSMLVILPKKLNGLTDLEQQLTPAQLSKWTLSMRKRTVATMFPKFKLESSFNLNEQLQKLGMQKAFTGAADFSGIASQEELYISAVVHKAFVDVNEKGTEAAAATGVIIAQRSARVDPDPVFRADHPFLFAIRDNRTEAILFLGRVVDPTR